MKEFISVKDRLPDFGEVVDIYITCGKDFVRVCDVRYLGEFDGNHGKLHLFKDSVVCSWTGEDLSEHYSVEDDGVLYWSNIILPELEDTDDYGKEYEEYQDGPDTYRVEDEHR